MDKEEILQLIYKHLDVSTLTYIIDSTQHPGTDRGIYETWGGRAIKCYEAIKELYIECNK